MTPQRNEAWTYLQTLAWIRWRKLDRLAKFVGSEAARNWAAALVYPGDPAAAVDSPLAGPRVVCSNPGAQLDGAVRDGRLPAYAVKGLSKELIDPAIWPGLKVNKNSTAVRGDRVVAEQIIFLAADVMKLFGSPSETSEALAADEGAILERLIEYKSQGPKRPRDNATYLKERFAPALGATAWKRVCKASNAAPTSDASWRKTGPVAG